MPGPPEPVRPRDFATSDDPRVQEQLNRLAALSLPQGRLSLRPVRQLLAALGDPHLRLPPVFHVAGTNGKGSTCAFLRAMLEADGKRVHQFTSPHLVRYNERIRIAGELVDDAMLADLLGEVLDARGTIAASFFEITTAAAFLAFARNEADAAIVEVGLGGRFDATNAIADPACCGIASLGLDHEQFLLAPEDGAPAEPMARIAFEKSGIVKPGRPLVTQSYGPDAQAEVERAARTAGAPLHMRGADWSITGGDMLEYHDRHGALTLPPPALSGAFQAENAGLAIAMLRHQDFVTVSPEAIAAGLRDARWPGRLQWLGKGPLTAMAPGFDVLLDGGHNPDAARVLAAFCAGLDRPVHAVIGMLANKDAERFLALVSPHLESVTGVPIVGHPHHAPERIAAMTGGDTARDVGDALARIAARTDGGVILIGGSLYLAGEVLRANGAFPD
ncbi:folylpolyglutamate synthase/dihydrofolate synthase family protein [Croceicoccus sp. YJ47]|uniref:bifunctional folylpolyglutamate synthase/dihydrofolate synthase n=1 Tax=Croceicoccus sp. YJ47 TaxID=2798724 RepID=UPI001922CF94|nr:folylpolyglutamate synthase/dihydrofolate synthase family protein [Croceicoccus sp. YJ47]QQN73859.1 bifunctional folylpolyglutamate synthase/dihydrofolate synthase [Croceicoccus sp. YJ47]